MADVLTLGLQSVRGGAPEWVHLLKNGPNETRDGRGILRLDDASAVLSLLERQEVDLPVDFHH